MNALDNWFTLNNTLRKASEAECRELLREEKRGKRRLQFIIRIYGRYSRLRTIRERNELVKGL